MASVRTVHFRVDNGDMTLVEFESGQSLLIDINIRGVFIATQAALVCHDLRAT